MIPNKYSKHKYNKSHRNMPNFLNNLADYHITTCYHPCRHALQFVVIRVDLNYVL